MKKHILTLIIAIFIVVKGLFASNDQYQIEFQRPLSVADGLASNEVNCMLQDSRGFMWFGTNNGLSRYDGYTFKSYKSNYLHPNYFSNNNIRCLAEDKSNNLWIGTLIGLNKIDLKTGKVTLFTDKKIQNTKISSIVFSEDNTPYIATLNGVYFYNSKTDKFQQLKKDIKGHQLKNKYIRTLYIDSKNFLWIGTWETGYDVYNLNTNLFTDYPYLKDKQLLIVNNIFEDDRHNIWLSTWDKYGVIRIENPHQPSLSKITVFYPQKNENSTVSPVVYAISQDNSNGNILLATANGLQIIEQAYRFEKQVQLNKSNSIKISGNEIFSMYIDRSGLLWYSIYGVGTNALSSNKVQFEQYNLVNMFKSDNLSPSITGIYEGDNGLVWLGLKSMVLGLFDRNENKLTMYNNHPVLKKISGEANSIYSFYKPKQTNELWLGSRYDGLYIVTFSNNKIASIKQQPIEGVDKKNLGIKAMLEVDNRIWLATTKGLVSASWDANNNYVFEQNDVLRKKFLDKTINTIIVDNAKNLWVGTQNEGLYKISFHNSKTKITEYSLTNDKLNNNEVLSLLQDFKNRIWVGTKGGGLSLFDEKENQFKIIENMSLFPDDAIYSIEEDNWENLWLATGNGLVSYNEDVPVDQKIRIFSGKEGVIINSYNPNSVFKNRNKELFFGGNNGFISFAPEKEEEKSFSPQPVICALYINNIPFDGIEEAVKTKISETDIPYTDHVTLSYDQNNIIIEFSALLFENISALKYAYKLNGIDNDWVYVDSKKRFVNYNNLPKGTYSFQIKSCNSLGQWCDQPTTLKIKLKPAPWDSTLAYIIYLLLILVIAFVVSKFVRNRMHLKKMLSIELIERDKSEEVHQAKLKFFTNISHEFFTPITIMNCTLEGLAKRHPDESETMFNMKANMNRLVRLLEQIVEFRKVETGNLKLKISNIEIVSFIKELCDVHFMPLCSQNNITLKFETNKDEIEGYVDVDKLDKIIFNLLSNAFKYNKLNGSVTVKIDTIERNNGRYLLVDVHDTGHGMTEEVKQNLFKRFYEGNFRDFKVKSIGIGLSLTHDLVAFHNGEITVESTAGVGSTFHVSLPIDKDIYEEEQMFHQEELANNNLASLLMEENEYAMNSTEKIRVLLVEDNLELLQTMSEALNAEFSFQEAYNGKEALEILYRNEVDIVVTDVVMPEMDGIELTTEMKNDVNLSHIPVLMLSAKHDVEHKVEGFEAGADAYVTKPFEMAALIANIKSLVRNRKMLAKSFGIETEDSSLEKYSHNHTDKDFLAKIVKIIEENVLEKSFTTNDLYDAINMSQSTLYRKLQVLIGISPNELIKNIRLKVACRLLLEKKLNISEIAYDLGFSDPKYFSNIFKKEMGISPTEYIKQNS